MFQKGWMRTLMTGGMIAAIGYMLMPRRRRNRSWFERMLQPLSRKNLMRMGRFLTKAMAR